MHADALNSDGLISPDRQQFQCTNEKEMPFYLLYGFKIDKWLDHPVPNGVDCFPSEERRRCDAYAYAYCQTGIKENWYRYLLLGFYVFDNCYGCNKGWALTVATTVILLKSIVTTGQ
jgi:hypothetical protein